MILTRDFLNDLLAKSDDGNVRLSHNDVACALLWQEHMATVAVDEKEVSLVNPVDFRRVLAGFPHNYAGNAVVLSRTDILRDELLAAPIGNTARLIRANLLRVNDNYIQNSVRALTSRLTKDPRHGCDTIHITNPCSGILMTNLSRLPLDGLDFGNGTPLSCMPLTPCRNTIVFTSDRCGGMEAHIQL